MTKENNYFGKDCPKGMVQVEFVGCSPNEKHSEYGWKPVDSAFIEVYVDGNRFRIDIGTLHDGDRRGMRITTDKLNLEEERYGINSVELYLKDE